MSSIKKVAVFGASGNFGAPITAALVNNNFDVTVISRIESTATFPEGLPVIRTAYTLEDLTKALAGQDGVVCAVGPAGMGLQSTMIDAAEAAGVRRFIIDDFGWGPDFQGLPDFAAIKEQRVAGSDHAKTRSESNPDFTWTAIATGNPIDWALKKFPPMGIDVANNIAIIYDSGTESFTGTTLDGIGQAVVGVFQHLEETKNRCVKVMSLKTCQNELLEAVQNHSKQEWDVKRSTTKELLERGRVKRDNGERDWTLDLAIYQLLMEGGYGRVAESRQASDSDLLGVAAVSPAEIAAAILA